MLNPNKLNMYRQVKEFSNTIYNVAKRLPVEEKYLISQQLKRAVLSIGANIAEGCGRSSRADMIRFFHMSLGSVLEVKYFLETSHKLKYLTDEEFSKLYAEANSLSRQIISFIKS